MGLINLLLSYYLFNLFTLIRADACQRKTVQLVGQGADRKEEEQEKDRFGELFVAV